MMARAHIVPRWDGGSDRAANLHLLCRICHEISEGYDGLSYWRWFREQTFQTAIQQGAAMRVTDVFGAAAAAEIIGTIPDYDLASLAIQYAFGMTAADPLAMSISGSAFTQEFQSRIAA
jgi:hypothetical protein